MRLLFLLVAVAPACAPSMPEAGVANLVEDWRDEVIYQLMTDRFANGDRSNDFRVAPGALGRYQGGDWQGIIDHLDYLEALGVTAIWISPTVQNVEEDAGVAGYHGYWQQDFTRPNAHFGDRAKLVEMVAACHARGIKVILDIVTNHIGQLFFYDINLNGQPDDNVFGSGTHSLLWRVTEYDPDYDARGIQAATSLGEAGPAPVVWRYDPALNRVPPMPAEFRNPEWYNRRGRVTDWGQFEQVVYADFPGGLKDLNTENPDVRVALTRVFDDLAREFDFDGFRIDTLKHVEHGFWQAFAPAIRASAAARGKEHFFMFGEAFDGDDQLVGSFTAPGELDSAFYFPQKFRLFDDVVKWGQPTANITSLLGDRENNYSHSPQQDGAGLAPVDALVGFIDNHDLPRYLNQSDLRTLHNALLLLFTLNHVPCLYYGTEQGFSGGNDPANREVLWQSDYATSGPTFEFISTLAQIRRDLAPLRRGDLAVKWDSTRTGDEQDAGIFAFERTYENETVLVVVNVHDSHTSETSCADLGIAGCGDMVTTFPEGTQLTNIYPDDDPKDDFVVGAKGALLVRVAPRSGKILVAK